MMHFLHALSLQPSKQLNEIQIIIAIIIHKRELIYRKIKIICLVTQSIHDRAQIPNNSTQSKYIDKVILDILHLSSQTSPSPFFSTCSVFHVGDFYGLHPLSSIIFLYPGHLTDRHYKQEMRKQEESRCGVCYLLYSIQDHSQQSHLSSSKGSFCTQRCNQVLISSPPLNHCFYS